MQRVISLFREPDEGYAPSSPAEGLPKQGELPEPLYFVQLLEYLRQRREAVEAQGAASEAVERN